MGTQLPLSNWSGSTNVRSSGSRSTLPKTAKTPKTSRRTLSSRLTRSWTSSRATPSSPPGWSASQSTRVLCACASARPARPSPWTRTSRPKMDPSRVTSPSGDPTRSRLYGQNELGEILRKTIQGLPPGFRTVFTLRDVENLSTEETAEALGLSVPAVKSRLLRARLQLRERLSRYFGKKNGGSASHDLHRFPLPAHRLLRRPDRAPSSSPKYRPTSACATTARSSSTPPARPSPSTATTNSTSSPPSSANACTPPSWPNATPANNFPPTPSITAEPAASTHRTIPPRTILPAQKIVILRRRRRTCFCLLTFFTPPQICHPERRRRLCRLSRRTCVALAVACPYSTTTVWVPHPERA